MNFTQLLLVLGLAASTSYAANIQINLTRSGAPSETGFTNWETGDNSLPSNLSVDGLTLSVVDINAGSTLRSIDRGGNDPYVGTLFNLTQTWWGQRSGATSTGGYITIDVSGLTAGEYTFTGWHLDHEDQTGEMKIEFSNDNGGSFSDAVSAFDLVAGEDVPTPTTPIETTFSFTSTGADVQFRFTNTSTSDADPLTAGAFALVNGFAINEIPEPSSVALFGLAGGLVVLRRRR